MNEHGILLFNKESGPTSASALTLAKKYLQIKKAGHGGTLDPLASGLLVFLFGEATRYASHLLAGDKRYLATFTFGCTSTTDDADGALTPVAPPPDIGKRLMALLPQFCGNILQTAPAYSALKHCGRPLYTYARRGETAPAKTRRVRIDALKLINAGGSSATLDIKCGSGVYIRALARDLGAALGCGAYLSALQRTACGRFNLADAVATATLAAKTPAECRRQLLPIDAPLRNLPAITLPAEQAKKLGSGGVIYQRQRTRGNPVRVLSTNGRFAGLAEYREGGYRPLRLLSWTRQQ